MRSIRMHGPRENEVNILASYPLGPSFFQALRASTALVKTLGKDALVTCVCF